VVVGAGVLVLGSWQTGAMMLSQDPDVAAAGALEAAGTAWARRLSTIAVRTPSAEFDAIVNRAALYQALACRMWARSALYQSSGAYGFRDQLQDGMAFVHAEPGVTRAHRRVSRAPVRRGRRAALVASPERARHPHPLLGRSGVAALLRRAVRARHR
jgi:hypothetical protein